MRKIGFIQWFFMAFFWIPGIVSLCTMFPKETAYDWTPALKSGITWEQWIWVVGIWCLAALGYTIKVIVDVIKYNKDGEGKTKLR